MKINQITIELQKTADPSALSFEAYYYNPTLICGNGGKKPVRMSTSINTRSLKSAVFRAVSLAGELSSNVNTSIDMFDEYSEKTVIDTREILVDTFGRYEIRVEDDKSLNKFVLGKKMIKKEKNE